jgi:uncharacterized membrane protein
MNKNRIEAFSDGVIAIIITIMVLEIKMPHEGSWDALQQVAPAFFSYILSFIFIGIYWANHHHLLHIVKRVSSGIIWANLNLLFWLSLVPFATSWMGETHFSANTVACYAILLMLCGLAFTILQRTITQCSPLSDTMKKVMKRQTLKGYLSTAGYASAIPLAYIQPVISGTLFVLVSFMWIIPDKNIEKALAENQHIN